MLYFQNPKRYELQFGTILKLKHQRKTLGGFIEIAFIIIGGKIQPIESCQARMVAVAKPVVVEPPCTMSMGNSNFGGLYFYSNHHIFATIKATDMVLVLCSTTAKRFCSILNS